MSAAQGQLMACHHHAMRQRRLPSPGDGANVNLPQSQRLPHPPPAGRLDQLVAAVDDAALLGLPAVHLGPVPPWAFGG